MNRDKNVSALTRRDALKVGAIASAAIAAPAAAATLCAPMIVVFDSRLAESLAFARTIGKGHEVDLAAEHAALFAAVRGGLPKTRTVEGMTRWSDWVALRGELETQGWRVTAEERLAPRGRLFRWSMTRA
ncbi:hypothetical protein [Novosphingobium sp.]|uniref:hypothetical protein n=1 Tax=Novosphingobium sp. TaxID=1874826 RepID=UPI0035AE9179